MAANQLSDLLPISPGNTKPNAYQVFGLPIGESNPEVIQVAIGEVISRVKEAKSKTEPTLWKQVAGIVQAARVTLADPDKKSRLDAKLGLGSAPAAKPPESKSVDPLAALLPPVDPMRPANPKKPATPATVASQSTASTQSKSSLKPVGASTQAVKPSRPDPAQSVVGDQNPPVQANPIPPGLFSTPAVDPKTVPAKPDADATAIPPVPDSPASIASPTAQPKVRAVPRRKTRRRKSAFVPIIMSIITLSLVALVGLLAYALFFRKESIAISRSGGGVKITSNNESQDQPRNHQPVVNQPQAIETESVPDLPPEVSQFPMREEMLGESESKMEMVETFAPMNPPAPPVKATSEPVADFFSDQEPVTSSMENGDNVDTSLTELRSAIRNADWVKMAELNEAIYQMKLNPKQQTDSDGLLNVAGLATFYRGGIERAVEGLNAGDDFEVKDGFRVVVVDKTKQSITVRYNAKSHEYKFDAMPLSLAHRLATFQVPDDSTGDASKAVYQAVAPKSTPGHREQAIGWLNEIDQPIEGVDRDVLVQTLLSIYGDK